MRLKYQPPMSYDWFSKLNLSSFKPWDFVKSLDVITDNNPLITEIEIKNQKILTFGKRVDKQIYAGFQIINQRLVDKVIVVVLSSNLYDVGEKYITSEHDDLFGFIQDRVIQDMKGYST